MEFRVKHEENYNIRNYPHEELKIAHEFAKQSYKEFGSFLKAVVIFGSLVRNNKKVGDIDVLLIIDDVSITLTPEVMETYKIISENLVLGISSRLHVTTLRLTTFWEYIKVGDPIIINMLRDGVPLIDTGFFEPLQRLLFQGRIKPTYESIYSYFQRSTKTLHNSKLHLLQGTIDLYWAVIDAAHAALMAVGEMPPTPEHAADLIHEKLVKTKMLEERYSVIMRNFYYLFKQILHREVREISGEHYMHYYKQAEDFVQRVQKLLDHIERGK